MILLQFLFFIEHKKVSAGISIYNNKFISVFVKIFYIQYLKWKKSGQELLLPYSKK